MEFLKKKNNFGFEEYFIQKANDMNTVMYVRDENKPRLVQQTVCEKIDKINSSVYNFAIFEKITRIELYDHKKSMNMAGGFYAYIKKLCFSNIDIKKERFKVAPGLLWHNDNYMNEELSNVWCYDLNSAYLSILGQGCYPNIENNLGYGIVKENEIGFSDWCGVLSLSKTGEFAEHRFKKVFSQDLRDWAYKKYAYLCELKKQKETTKAQELKLGIVAAIGMIRNHNAFLYEYIVGSCKQYMENLIDENTLICNTDSIICMGERKDLNIGINLGEFKIEYQGVDFIYYNSNYQVSKDKNVIYTKYRGIPKAMQEDMNFKEHITTQADYYLEGDILWRDAMQKE